MQRLQFFLSEAAWDGEAINTRHLALLCADTATAPSPDGVLVIDDTGDRKDGHATDHVARQYLGSVGKVDNGIVAVTTLWASEEHYYPLHVVPYTPEKRLPAGKQDGAFRTKPQIALSLVEQAQAAGTPFCAIVADCFYGDNHALETALLKRGLPHVLARRGDARTRLGASAGGSFVQGCGALVAAGRLAPSDPALSRRPHRALVGRRAHAAGLWARPGGARSVRHDRPARAALAVDLVPHHQPVTRAGPAGRDRAHMRSAKLDRAGLQTDEGRAGLGRLHGAKRPGNSPSLDAGVLRVCLLLVACRRSGMCR